MLDLCIEIIDKCPNECLFCSSKSCISKNNIITFEEYKKVVDYFIINGGIKELSISGGEPLLHPNIYEMIMYAKERNIKVVLFTSGVKIPNQLSTNDKNYYIDEMNKALDNIIKNEPDNKYYIDNIKNYYLNFIKQDKYSEIKKEEFSLLESIGLDKIVFDFQGYESETDTYLMGRTNSMHNYLIYSLWNASRTDIEVDVHFVPMKPNYKQIKDILELLEIANIKNISILKFVPQGRGRINKDSLELTEYELIEFKKYLDNCKKIYSGNIRMGIHMQEDNRHKCNAGFNKYDIRTDKVILPCPALKEITIEQAKRNGINLYTIDEIEKVKVLSLTRDIPLCQKVYSKKYQ